MAASIDIEPNFVSSWVKIPSPGIRTSSDSTYDPSRGNETGDGWKNTFKITRANQIVANASTSYYKPDVNGDVSTMLKDGTKQKAKQGNYLYQPFQQPTTTIPYTSTTDNWPEDGDLWISGHRGILAGFERNVWVANANNLDCQFDNSWHLVWRDKNVRNTSVSGLNSDCYVNRNTSYYENGPVPRLRAENKFYGKKETSPVEYTITRIKYPTLNQETTRYHLYAEPKNKPWFYNLKALKNQKRLELLTSQNPVLIEMQSNSNSGWVKNPIAIDTFKKSYIKDIPVDCNTLLEDVKTNKVNVQIPSLKIPTLNPPNWTDLNIDINTTIPYNHVPNYYAKLQNKIEANAILEPLFRIVKTNYNVVDYYTYNDINMSEHIKTGVVDGLPIPTPDEIKRIRLNFTNGFNELVHSLYKNGITKSREAFRNLFGITKNGKLTKLNSTMVGSFAIPSFINSIYKQGSSHFNASSNCGYIKTGIPFVGYKQQCSDRHPLNISSNITITKVLKPNIFNYPQNAYQGNLPLNDSYYSNSSNGNSLLINNQSGTNLISDLLPPVEIQALRTNKQLASRLEIKEKANDMQSKTINIPFVYNLYLANSSDCSVYRDAFMNGVKVEETINPCCCNLGEIKTNSCNFKTFKITNAAMVSFPYFYFKIDVNKIYADMKKLLYNSTEFIPTLSGSHSISKSDQINLSLLTYSPSKTIKPMELIEHGKKFEKGYEATTYAKDLRLIRNADFTTKTTPIYSVMQDLNVSQTCYSVNYKYE